jgi:hypothetical protein
MSYNYNKLELTLPEGGKALDLVLKGEWWEAWQEDKDEDYRELTNYWITRLFGKESKFYNCLGLERDKVEVYNILSVSPKRFLRNNEAIDFTHIRLSKAYGKDRLSGYVEFGGIEIREGKPEWGAKAGRLYFCIMRKGYKHGDKVL